MKKVLLSSLAALTAFAATAQVKQMTEINGDQSARLKAEYTQASSNRASGAPSIAAPGDTLWYEDFGNGIPTSWSQSGADATDNPWKHSFVGSSGYFNDGTNGVPADPALLSATAANGFMLNDADSANNDVNGQPAGSTYVPLESYITTSAIDLTGQPAVRLAFTQSFRYFDAPSLDVSVSTDSVNWTDFDVSNGIAVNAASPDPMEISIDISSIAGNSSTVYLKFGWATSAYYWMIDDIRLVVPPASDLGLTEVRPRGYSDSTMLNYYQMVPERQANADTLIFGSIFENFGSANATNVVVSTTVDKDGSNVFTGMTNPMTMAAGAIDSSNATTNFIPNGLGAYTVTHVIGSDSVDAAPGNNTLESAFEVSLNEYRWDNDQITSGNWYNATTNVWQMAVAFEFNAADTAVGVSVMFPDLTNDYGLDAGDPLSYYILDADLNIVASNEFYIATADDEDSWVTLPVYAELTPGLYYASFKVYTAETAVASNSALNSQVSPFRVLVNVDEATQWSYTTSLMPFVRILTKNSEICDNTIVSGTGTVTDNQPTGSIDFTPSGGTAPYSFSWTGPNGYSSTDQNLSGLAEQGTYTVVTTDLNGCSSDPIDFTVAGIVSSEDAAFNSKINVFPNPNSGVFNVNMTQVEGGRYTIRTTNILGAVVSVQNVEVNGSYQAEMNMSAYGKGIYFVEVSNEFGQASTFKVIVK